MGGMIKTTTTRTKLVILLLVIVYITYKNDNICLLFYYKFGHPNFIVVNPLDGLNVCQRTITFSKRQPVKEVGRSIGDLEMLYEHQSSSGGRFRPERPCTKGRTAIIIPYRNRMKHLQEFLSNALPKLLRQKIDFTIFIIEQAEGSGFNRGMLSNIGFMEAKKSADFNCFIFNDVDTIIEDDRNMYHCNPNRPRHLVSSTDENSYWLPYHAFVGGIIGFTAEQFERIHGYSNLFFLWGGEDDDLYRRILEGNFTIERPPDPIGAVTKLKHAAEKKNEDRFLVYDAVKGKSSSDGVNNLSYAVLNYKLHKLFTWITVALEEDVIKRNGKAILNNG